MREFILCFLGVVLSGRMVWAEPLPVSEVAPGVFVHQGVHEDLDAGYHGDICNIGFIVGRDSVAVIDTGGSLGVGQRLREAVRHHTALPIRYVINTHVHPDHVFGNAAFLEDHPAFVGHHRLADAMERRSQAYLRNNAAWLGADAAGSVLVRPTTAVAASLELDLGERVLRLTAHPVAHTHTDLTVLDMATATLWSGDLLFVERTPSLDGDLKGWLEVIGRLAAEPVTAVVPGHGPFTRDWKAALAAERRYLEALLHDVRDSIRRRESMEHAMTTAAAAERERWVLFDRVNRRNVNVLYPVLEWE